MNIKNYLRNKIKHKTLRNIGFLTVGNIISQLISLIGAFYIPKLLGPERYGIYQTVISYVGMFTFLTFSGLNKVIIRECAKDIEKTRQILEETIGLRNMFSFLAAIVSIFVVIFIDYDKGTKFFISIFSISLIINGFQSSFNTIYQSFEDMRFLAAFSIVKQIIFVPLAILLLEGGYGILSLLILNLIVNFLSLIVNYFYTKKFVVFNIFSKIRLIKYYIKSGFNFTLLEFLNTLSGKVDLVMLSFLTTPENVGLYALAYRITEKGLIIRNPISQSLFPYYTKKINAKEISKKTLFKHTLIILLPSLIIAISVLIFSEDIIIKLVGAKFNESARILNVLIFYLIFNYSVIPFGITLQVSNNEKTYLVIGFIRAILNILLNLIFYHLYGLIGIAYSTLFVYLTSNTFVIIKGSRILRKQQWI